jgi:hypothetical protein
LNLKSGRGQAVASTSRCSRSDQPHHSWQTPNQCTAVSRCSISGAGQSIPSRIAIARADVCSKKPAGANRRAVSITRLGHTIPTFCQSRNGDLFVESILIGDAGSLAAFADSRRGHRAKVGANARAGTEPQPAAFGFGSVAVSEDRATRRTDEKGPGGPKEWKF